MTSMRALTPEGRPTLAVIIRELLSLAGDLCPELVLPQIGARVPVTLLSGVVISPDDDVDGVGGCGASGDSAFAMQGLTAALLEAPFAPLPHPRVTLGCSPSVFHTFFLPPNIASLENRICNPWRFSCMLARCSPRLRIGQPLVALIARLETAVIGMDALAVAEAFSGLQLSQGPRASRLRTNMGSSGAPDADPSDCGSARSAAGGPVSDDDVAITDEQTSGSGPAIERSGPISSDGSLQPCLSDPSELSDALRHVWRNSCTESNNPVRKGWASGRSCAADLGYATAPTPDSGDISDVAAGDTSAWDAVVMRVATTMATGELFSDSVPAASSRSCVVCGVTSPNSRATRHYFEGASRHFRSDFLAAALVFLFWHREAVALGLPH